MPLRMDEQTLVTVKQQLHRALRHIRQQRHMDLPHHVFLAAEAAAHQLSLIRTRDSSQPITRATCVRS